MARGRVTWMVGALMLVSMAGTPLMAAGDGDKGKGEKIYKDQKCSVCHIIGGAGGKMGPDLSKVGTARDKAWLAKYLANPKAKNPKNKMPPVKSKGADLADLIAYMLSLKGK